MVPGRCHLYRTSYYYGSNVVNEDIYVLPTPGLALIRSRILFATRLVIIHKHKFWYVTYS